MEKWQDIKGYEGLYQISNLGNVKSLTRIVNQGKYGKQRIIAEKVMMVNNNGNGYLIVALWKNSKRKQHYIHRLVAEHFVEKANASANVVNHIDFNIRNNIASNLEWVTQAENVRHSVNRMRKPRTVTKSATGHKYIYPRNGRFRVCIPQHSERSFSFLEDAIAYKGVVMNERKIKHIAG